MALLEDRTVSFVIKVWREGSSEGSQAWRGSIEQVETRDRGFFRDLSTVGEFMKPYLEAIGIDLGTSFWDRMDESLSGTADDPADRPTPASRAAARRRPS